MPRLAAALLLVLVVVLGACAGPEDESPTPGGSPVRDAPPPTATRSADHPTVSPRSPTPSATPTPTPEVALGTYIALGDSLAVGVGASDPGTTGYVARVHAALSEPTAGPHVTGLANLAVSGETSESLVRGGQLDAALDAIETAADGDDRGYAAMADAVLEALGGATAP